VDEQQFFIQDGERAARDGAGDQIALIFADPDGSGPQPIALRSRLLYGPAVDQILAEEQLDPATGTGNVLWPLTDNLGTARDVAAFDAALGITEIVNHLVYDAAGNVTSETDSDYSPRVKFTAREFDAESALSYLRARYYDAAISELVNEDPKGFEARDPNLRRYVRNSATNATDPSGLEGWWQYLPAEIAKRQEQLNKEYERSSATGEIPDEFSVNMGFWKSVYFGSRDMLNAVTEFGAVTFDIAAGTWEAGLNGEIWIANQFGADLDYSTLPQFSKSTNAIDEHFRQGGS
jgi:RHS repeat-associated protein